MSVIANLLTTLAVIIDRLIVDFVLTIYLWVIVARALISWVNPDPYNTIVQVLYKVTEPVLYPIRRVMGSYSIGIDFSPLIAILLIYVLQISLEIFVVQSLIDIAQQLS